MLEIVILLTVGISSFNIKAQVPSHIPEHNQIIPAHHLKSQEWLDKINDWTLKQKMVINENKTKTMIFNYTNNYQFSTSLKINDKDIDIIDSTRLTMGFEHSKPSEKSKCQDGNIKKGFQFWGPHQDLKEIYILFVRCLLEQSATVWHSLLTKENTEDLERVQKNALRIILKDQYQTYKKALVKLGLENLSERREKLCLTFAQKCIKNPKTAHMFPMKEKTHIMQTRNPEKFQVQSALNDRLKKSPIIYMQNLLNKNL